MAATNIMSDVEDVARENAKRSGGSYKKVSSMEEAFKDADIVYPKSWAPFAVMQERTKLVEEGKFDDLKDLEKRCLANNAKFKNWTCSEELMKTTKDGNGLGGATFALYRRECTDNNHDHSNDEIAVNEKGDFLDNYGYKSCWKLVQTAISDSTSGLVSFTDIPTNGEYRLVEIKVPDGYVNPGGQWKIVYADGYFQPKGDGDASVGNPPAIKVDGTGEDATYSIINYEPGELPFSGNTGILMFLLLGAILMGAGAGGTIWYQHTHRRRRSLR